MNATQLHQTARDGVMRRLAVALLAGIAVIHVLDAPAQFAETPYLGWMYVVLIVGCIAIGGSLLCAGEPRAWLAAGALALSVLVGYTLSRVTGLPGSSDDIGDWGNRLGIASLLVEGAVVAISAFALLDHVPQVGFRTAAAEPV